MGPGRAFLRLCFLVCGWLAGSVPYAMAQQTPPATASWGLVPLMHELAQVSAASARFTERKTMHMLKTPLVTSGTLKYMAPGLVQKITVQPVPERFVLDGNRVTITGGADHQTHAFSLTEAPQIAGLVEGIRAILAGDLATLDHFYVVQLSGNAGRWQILLQPRDAALAHFITSMRIQGSEDRVEAIDTAGRNGDHSDMRIDEDVIDVR